jgi:hypothetical protein
MFPGLALAGQTADQVLITPSSPDKPVSAANTTTTTGAAAFDGGLAAALSKVPPLSQDWAEKAASELNEKPETVQETISSLRSMVLGRLTVTVQNNHRILNKKKHLQCSELM